MTQFSNILYLARQDDTDSALDAAISLCKINGGRLSIVSVITTMLSAAPTGRFHDELAEAFEALRAKRLNHLHTLKARIPKGIEAACEVMDGSLPIEVVRRVLNYDHDLVVAQAQPQQTSGPLRRLFASEDMQMMRKCPCAVLILKPSVSARFDRVFAAVDFDREDDDASPSAFNRRILSMAAGIADTQGQQLDVANAYDAPGEGAMVAGWIPTVPENLPGYIDRCRADAEDRLNRLVQQVATETRLANLKAGEVKTHVVKGWARYHIPRLVDAAQADLVVMGTVGRVGVPGLLIGNTAETILGEIDCSVLVLKPDGFVTPVTLD